MHTVEVEKILGGKKSTARLTAHPFFDAEGKITSVIETIEDVSDHVLTKQALHTADQFSIRPSICFALLDSMAILKP